MIDSTIRSSPNAPDRPDAWLCELTIPEGSSDLADAHSAVAIGVRDESIVAGDLVDGDGAARLAEPAPRRRSGVRASDQGFLPIQLDKYLAILDWTGRQIRGATRLAIPDHFPPILERLGLKSDGWVETVRKFGRLFKTAVGRPDALTELARQRQRLAPRSDRRSPVVSMIQC